MSGRKRQEVGVFEHEARALLTVPRDARGQPVTIDEIRRELALTFATDGAPGTGRVLLESDSTQARSLEGRSLAMYSSLRLPDRSRISLLDPPRRLAAASERTEATDVRLQRVPRVGVTTSHLADVCAW
jgi:hypothetical protein